MQIEKCWRELMYDLQCLNKRTAKKQFKHIIRSSFGGLCAYCRAERATTVDHIIPKCSGGTSFKNNLLPCCVSCNRSKGSENWLDWYKRQEYYNEVVTEVIKEWIENSQYSKNEHDDWTNNRTTFRLAKSEIRVFENEQTCIGKDSITTAQIEDGTEERSTECAYG